MCTCLLKNFLHWFLPLYNYVCINILLYTQVLIIEENVFILWTHVVIPPIIIRQPTQQIVYIHQSVTFHCEAEGFQVTYLWKKCDENKNLVIARNSNFILSNVIPFNNGQYYCEATNDGGTTPSNIVSLKVKGNQWNC